MLHKDLSEEARRQRYADLIVRQEARDMVRTKATVLTAIRDVLHDQGYIEVETPVLQLIHGGAAARPFRTHMNAFDQQMVLRIALELNLKKAVVGGVDRVYELGRIFRNEGVDATHSPEFTMLEAYQAYGDQTTIARLTQDIIVGVADALGSRQVPATRADGTETVIDLDGEWRWLKVYDAVSEAVGEPVTIDTPQQTLLRHAREHGVEVDPDLEKDKLFLELLSELVEPRPDPADVPLRLPGAGPAAGPSAPQRARADRGVGPHHRRGRARHRILRTHRPDHPAGGAHRPVVARRRR